jgi:hypothetical protein
MKRSDLITDIPDRTKPELNDFSSGFCFVDGISEFTESRDFATVRNLWFHISQYSR